jgi:hypothetical protein
MPHRAGKPHQALTLSLIKRNPVVGASTDRWVEVAGLINSFEEIRGHEPNIDAVVLPETRFETYPTPANGMLPLMLLSLTEHRMSWTKGRSVAPPAVPPVAVYLCRQNNEGFVIQQRSKME